MLLQRLCDEWQVRFDNRDASSAFGFGHTRLRDYALHGAVVYIEFATDGAHSPVFGQVQAQYLGALLIVDCHTGFLRVNGTGYATTDAHGGTVDVETLNARREQLYIRSTHNVLSGHPALSIQRQRRLYRCRLVDQLRSVGYYPDPLLYFHHKQTALVCGHVTGAGGQRLWFVLDVFFGSVDWRDGEILLGIVQRIYPRSNRCHDHTVSRLRQSDDNGHN